MIKMRILVWVNYPTIFLMEKKRRKNADLISKIIYPRISSLSYNLIQIISFLIKLFISKLLTLLSLYENKLLCVKKIIAEVYNLIFITRKTIIEVNNYSNK